MRQLARCCPPPPPPDTGAGPVTPPALTEAVLLDTLVAFRGTAEADVQFIELSGFRLTHAATTQLGKYEIPSGGDWAVGRFGAVTIEAAANIDVTANWFDSVGGNAVGLFNRAKNNTVSGNRCSFPGDSCVVSVGSSNMVDGALPPLPCCAKLLRSCSPSTWIRSPFPPLPHLPSTALLCKTCPSEERRGGGGEDIINYFDLRRCARAHR